MPHTFASFCNVYPCHDREFVCRSGRKDNSLHPFYELRFSLCCMCACRWMFKKRIHFFLRRGMDSSIQVNEHFLTFTPLFSLGKKVITDFVQIVETESK